MDKELSDLEGLRTRLEENVASMRKLLLHWQNWEAEYEGFREALSGIEEGTAEEGLEAAASEFEGELLTREEIEGLLQGIGQRRTKQQILGILSRRIDYVHDNVKAAEKRLGVEQEKLEVANLVDHRDEGGLPLTEITEVLDEEDNVISTAVSNPGQTAPKILEALRQSGLTEEVNSSKTDTPIPGKTLDSPPKEDGSEKRSQPSVKKETESNVSKRKSVSFAESPEVIEPPDTKVTPENNSGRGIHLASAVNEIKQDLPLTPVIPDNESPKDTALRQEMLRYNMEEVGVVVAEMNLDDIASQFDVDYEGSTDGDDNDDDDHDDDYGSYDESDVEEDEFGRTTTRVVSEEYRKKMLELERKLNAQSLINIGPELKDSPQSKAESQEQVTDDEAHTEVKSKPDQQKSVRFAESLDIQEAPEKPLAKTKHSQSTVEHSERPVSEDIVERQIPPKERSSNAQSPKRVSKFKAARSGQNQTKSNITPMPHVSPVVNGPLAMQGLGDRLIPATDTASKDFLSIPVDGGNDQTVSQVLEGKTHANTLVERPPRDTAPTIREPDDFDPALLNKQVLSEYNKIQNRMIQQDDGFMSIDKEDLEDEDGRPRMSRFRAARLAHS